MWNPNERKSHELYRHSENIVYPFSKKRFLPGIRSNNATVALLEWTMIDKRILTPALSSNVANSWLTDRIQKKPLGIGTTEAKIQDINNSE